MFIRSEQKTSEINPVYTSVGSLQPETIENIIKMIDFLSSTMLNHKLSTTWVYVKDNKDVNNTHFKLNKGTFNKEGLNIDTIAALSSSGAVVNLAGDSLRIFKINMELLQQSYDVQFNEFNTKINGPTLGLFREDPDLPLFATELFNIQAAEQKEGCKLM